MSLFGEDAIVQTAHSAPVDGGVDIPVYPRTPQETPFCIGHDAQEQRLIDLYQKKTLPHALIFTGVEGIGKTTLAFRLARFLIKHGQTEEVGGGLFGEELVQDITSLDVAPDDPVFRQVVSGAHPDLLHISRTVDTASGKRDAALKVDALRKIEPFLRKTSSQGGWRVVIVEDADTMNRNAQNAILKILEEPPSHVLIILIAHRPGMMIPTIHSRAQVIGFKPLDDADMRACLDRLGHGGLTDTQARTLYALSQGSVGAFLRFMDGDADAVLRDILDHIAFAAEGKIHKLHEFADTLSAPAQDTQYRLFVELLLHVMRTILFIKARGGGEMPDYLNVGAMQTISAYPLETILGICDALKAHFERAEFSNLDRRDAVRTAFLMISQ